MRVTFLILFTIFKAAGYSQIVSDSRDIYRTILSHYTKIPGASITILDSTINDYVLKTNFEKIASTYKYPVPSLYIDKEVMDSTWIVTFKNMEKKKSTLQKLQLENFELSDIKAKFINKPETGAVGFLEYYSLSDILRSGNRAIVEFNRVSSPLDGQGLIYILEKCNGKWKIVNVVETWIS